MKWLLVVGGAAAVSVAVQFTAGAQSRRTAQINPWLGFETLVSPRSGVQFTSPATGFALSPQPINSLDDHLSAPAGLTISWPSPSVLVSRDGGALWRQSLSRPTGFWGLAFGDRLHGVAVGVRGLFRTVDGGRRWARVAQPAPRLVSVTQYGNPETLVGLTTSGRLFVSRDGGSMWRNGAWTGQARALCALGDAVVIADQDGGVWVSKDPDYPFTRLASGQRPPLGYSAWWVELSCSVRNAVELMQSLCEAACGSGVVTVIRQSTAQGFRWRVVARITAGAGNPQAPTPVAAVAVGTGKACLFSYQLQIRCTSDGGRRFTRARTPVVPAGSTLYLQGVSFLGPAQGWLLVDESALGADRRAGYRTQVWATTDGGAAWRVTYASRLRPAPSVWTHRPQPR